MANIYRMCVDGKRYVGTAMQLSELTGYHPRSIWNMAKGEFNPREGVTIEFTGNEKTGMIVSETFQEEWDKACAMFKNVIWVREKDEDVLKLEVKK